MNSKYRLYIDEVGNHDMRKLATKNERFLTLFGVAVQSHYMLHTLQPEMDCIKRQFFQTDPDEAVVFHRKEVARKQGVFSCLLNSSARQKFDETMLHHYEKWEYIAFVVTIDKREHLARYHHWANEPYLYCFKVLLERYVLFLSSVEVQGDVMIEARNPSLDKDLSNNFNRFFELGTEYVAESKWQQTLTSRRLKIKNKQANVCGLQLADLLAHPSQYSLLTEYSLEEEQTAPFGKRVASILRDLKYYRSPNGQLKGWGMKLLP